MNANSSILEFTALLDVFELSIMHDEEIAYGQSKVFITLCHLLTKKLSFILEKQCRIVIDKFLHMTTRKICCPCSRK
jgi:hypothetical protein